MAERTPQDYAIEHAEYMACSAERLIEAVNNLALAEQQRDELEGDKPEGVVDASDHAVESAREALGDDMSALRNRIYEFRKRRDRAAATPPAGAQQAVFDDEDISSMSLAITGLERITSGMTKINDDRLFATTQPRKMTINDAKEIASAFIPTLLRLREKMDATPAALAAPAAAQGAWTPTPESINALPQPVREYIHALEANCDPAGMVRENAMLRDTNAGLQKMYRTEADSLAEVRACFDMAEDEGLSAALAETSDERLKDLVERRLMHALAATPAPEAAPAEENKPVISIEDSLRTRLRWSEEKVEQLEHENRELRGRIPGPSFDDLMDGARASKKDTTTTDPEVSKVFIVATGETHDGQETYTRHDVRPPLCDAEVLYAMPSRVDEQADAEATKINKKKVIARWLADQWRSEVEKRPLVNVHRAELDAKWRQLLSRVGVDHRALLGPTHEELLAEALVAHNSVAEVERYKRALHYAIFALHDTPQHMLATGMTMYDNDRVSVKIDEFVVDTGRIEHPFVLFDMARAKKARDQS